MPEIDTGSGTSQCHVVVADALRALYRASRGLSVPPAVSGCLLPPGMAGADGTGSGGPAGGDALPRLGGDAADTGLLLTGADLLRPWRTIRLRRDGCRPLVFEGLRLLGREAATPAAEPDGARGRQGGADDRLDPLSLRHVFDLYLARSGVPVARLAMLVPEGVSARAVHTVRELDGPEALPILLQAHDPARGLIAEAGCPGATATEPSPDHAALSARLRADAQALVRAALRAAPLDLSPVDGE